MRRISILLVAVLLVSLLGFAPGTVALAATDDVAPVLVDAFPVKAAFAAGENVEYILIFNEPGGMDLSSTGVHFQLDGSISPASTQAYTGWINSTRKTDVTGDYRAQYPDMQGLYAMKVSIPIRDDLNDHFMSGTYRLDSLYAQDKTGNRTSFGCLTGWWGAGDPLPTRHDLSFTVSNPGVSLVAPVVKEFKIEPTSLSAGDTMTATLVLQDTDGIRDAGFTLWVNDPKLLSGFYQYYPPANWTYSAMDANGVTTLTQSIQIPDTMPPGHYEIGQFGVTDTLGNWNYSTSIYPIYPGLEDIAVDIANDAYVYANKPEVTEFLMSTQTAQPGDTVDFTVVINGHGSEIEDDANFYVTTDKGINIATPNLHRSESDGRYHLSYTLPADLVPGRLHFDIGVFFTDGNSYQVNTDGDGLPTLYVTSVFTGLDDISVFRGSDVGKLLEGVTASNGHEGDMTSKITIANPPDLGQPGVYLVRYEARSTLPVVNPFTSETTYADYIGYRWVGVTEELPQDADDPFVMADDGFAIGGVTANDVTVKANLGGAGFSEVNFANKYTKPGDYQVIKNNYGVAQSSAYSVTNSAFPATNRVLPCRVKGQQPGTHRVFFASNGGSAISPVSVPEGGKVTKPADPKRTGYTFAGWYKQAACTTAWNFTTGTVTANITLYAKWTINTYTVAFDSQGGSAVASKKANYNATITTPAAPTRTGYTFGGWYKEAACTHAWNFATGKVTANTTLFARWTAAPKCTVTVQTNNTSYGTVSGGGSYYNDKVTKATVTATPKSGYRFVRWMEGTTAVSTNYQYSFLVTKARTLKAEFAKIGIPAIKAASSGYNSVKLTWAAVAGAKEYEVYRYSPATRQYIRIATVAATGYINTGLTTNASYSYKVRAKCVAGSATTYSGYSTAVPAKPIPATPTGVKATSASYNSVKITWAAVAGATKYEVYRATSSTGTYTKLTQTTSTGYTSAGLTTGKTYYYKVRVYRLVGSTKVYGSYSAVVSAKPVPATPTGVKAARVSASSVKVNWNTAAGATGYEVYRATASGGTYTSVKSVSTHTGLITGKTYYYKVRAYRVVGGVKVYGGYSAVASAKP